MTVINEWAAVDSAVWDKLDALVERHTVRVVIMSTVQRIDIISELARRVGKSVIVSPLVVKSGSLHRLEMRDRKNDPSYRQLERGAKRFVRCKRKM